MCGISGFIGKENIDESIIKKTLSLMNNRGPNNQQASLFKEENFNVFLLHSRLSIIDLASKSNQPFTAYDKTIIFNGEIYNYLEIREQLRKRGYDFKTNSDTEVLLTAFHEYGDNVYEHLNGMWAFAIWDHKKKTLLLSRDIFGEKPLYFIKKREGIYFGSEIKYLKSLLNKKFEFDYEYINNFVIYGYRSLNKTPNSFFKHVKKVKSSHQIIIDSELNFKERRYFFPKFTTPVRSRHLFDEIKEELIRSVGLRLRSDVPISFCLSGGVDSSALASIASKVYNYNIKTYSIIDPDEKYDETENIKNTVNNLECEHHSIRINYSNMIERLRNLIKYHDSPISTISYLVHSMISEEISKTSSKVVISGTGADELFTGYYDHYLFHFADLKNKDELNSNIYHWEKYVKKFIRNKFLMNPDCYIKNKDNRENFYPDIKKYYQYVKFKKEVDLGEVSFCDSILRNRLMNELFYETVPVILNEDDLNSMCYSLENRSPFLDKNLLNIMLKVEPKDLIQDGYAKFILRKVLDGILNDKVRLDRKKIGFNVSINNIFNFKDNETYESFLEDSPVFDIYKKEKIKSMLESEEIFENDQKFLFNFMNLKFFLEQN